MSLDERKWLVVRSRRFYLLNNTLYHKGVDGIWQHAVRQFEKEGIWRKTQCGIVGGHYVGEAMARRIWSSGLWWATTTKDAVKYCRQCSLCQWIRQPTEKDRMAFQPVLPLKPSQKWSLDLVSAFKPTVIRTGKIQYIIVATTIVWNGSKPNPYKIILQHRQQNSFTKIYGAGSTLHLN